MKKLVVLLGAIIFLSGSFVLFPTGCGERPEKESAGDPSPDNPSKPTQKLTPTQKEAISKIVALGYLGGYRRAPKATGVTVYNQDLTYDGLNFFTSGHGPEAILMDMNGDVLFKWACDFETAWPDMPRNPEAYYWRRAHLFENGDVLAIFNTNYGIIKVDRNSRFLWAYQDGCHHDLFVTDDGTIYVLGAEERIVPRIDKNVPVWEDFICILNSQGELRKRIALLKAFEESPYAPLLDYLPASNDIFHTNTIEVLDGKLQHRSPAFRKGNVLISILKLNTIAVIDIETEKVVWALAGRWRMQHQPTVLENGRMLLFNNVAGDEVSEVIEFDPFTQEVHWSYGGDPSTPFYSMNSGSNQRLPNGNTLITESANSRAFEVTPDKTIVWEFISPYRAYRDQSLISSIPEVVRLPPDFPLDFTENQAPKAESSLN